MSNELKPSKDALRTMLRVLENYRDNDRRRAEFNALHILITDLENLITPSDGGEDGFRRKFYESWGGLETAYALALEAGRPAPTARDIRRIDGYVSDLETLIRSAIAKGADE